MNSALTKDILRTILKDKKRLLALMVITLLGVTMMCGLRAACDDLRASLDAFYDDQRLHDISIQSTLGLDDDDIAALADLDLIEDADGQYSEDVQVEIGGSYNTVTVYTFTAGGIDCPYVQEGTLPAKADEAAVTSEFAKDLELGVGDHITIIEDLDNDSETDDSGTDDSASAADKNTDISVDVSIDMEEDSNAPNFLVTDYVITAIVTDIRNFTNPEGATSSFRNTDGDNYEMFICPEAVDSDIYTAVNLTVAGAADLGTYEDAYDALIAEAMKEIETVIKADREQARYDAVYEEAAGLISDAEEEMNDAFADADEQFEDARKELDDGWDEIAENEQKLKDGENQLAEQESAAAQQIADARAQIADGKSQISDGENQLTAARDQLDASSAEIAAGELALDDGKVQIADSYARIEAGYSQLEAAEAELDENKAQLEAQEVQLKEEETELAKSKAQLEASKSLLETNKAQLEAQKKILEALGATSGDTGQTSGTGSDQLNASYARIQENLAQVETNLTQVEANLTQIEEASAQIEAGYAQIEAGYAQIEEGYTRIETARQELDRQKEALDAANAELEANEAALENGKNQISDGYAQIDAQEQTIAEKKAQLEAGEKELDQQEASAKSQIADAREELKEGKTELAEGKEKLIDGEAEYADNLAEYQDARAEAEEKLEDAREELQDIPTAVWYVQDRTSLSSYANSVSDTDCISAIGTAFPVMFLIIAVLISLTTITRMVEEDRGLIGTYQALGFYDSEIRRKYIAYSAAACIAGGICGNISGFIILPRILFIIFDTMYIVPAYRIVYTVSYGLGGIILFTGSICFATYLSCRATLKEVPASLMRPKPPRSGSRILLERISFLWRKLSFLNKVTARNLFRYKKRFLMTVFGIAGCTGLLVCGFGIKDTVTDLMEKQYDGINHYDLLAVTGGGDDNRDLLSLLDSQPVESLLNLEIGSVKIINEEGKSISAQIYVADDWSLLASYIAIEDTEKKPVTLEDGSVYVTVNAGRILGFEAGDPVTIQDQKLNSADSRVQELINNYLGNSVFMTRSTYEDLFEAYEPNAALICLEEGADELAVKDTLSCQDYILSVSSTQENRDSFSAAFQLMNLVVYIVIILAAGLAFVVLFTLSATNISERERELATIKVLGFYDSEVHTYVNKETLILTAIGIACGLPLGIVLCHLLMMVLKLPSVEFDISIHGSSFALSAGLAFLFALLVDLITNQTLNRIDPVEALKSVE